MAPAIFPAIIQLATTPPTMTPQRQRYLIAALTGSIFGMLLVLSGNARADLDEQGFEVYNLGELLNQDRWTPQQEGSGTFEVAPERMEVRLGEGDRGQTIVWIEGFGGKDQTRVVKTIQPTTSNKVLVRFEFLPGGTSLGGRLYFEQKDLGSVGVEFSEGTIRVNEPGNQTSTDTHADFQPESWNRFELRWDFEKHNVEVLLDGQSLGNFQIPDTMTAIDQLNFFAGGTAFSSAMDNLTIESVSDFPATQP